MCHATDIGILLTRAFQDKDYSLARCRACGQHFCMPAPSATEIAEFYQGDYHETLRTPGGSEQQFGVKFGRYRDWLLQFLRTGRTLDIGTATGLFPAMLKEAGFEAEGLEYNPESARWGQEHYGIRIQTCALEDSGAGPGAYDLISMTDVLEHTEYPLGYLKLARQYLRPGGFMLITFPDIESLESRYLRFISRVLHRDWIWFNCRIPHHVWEFTPATARAMFNKAGFEVAGFRRSHDGPPSSPGDLKLTLLQLPLRLLPLPLMNRLAGTQMEFVIRRRD
jgi:2-polyprenyl-3-methyl-5-hydroxy-6-metoxy-1,4-benzoquinol methylase